MGDIHASAAHRTSPQVAEYLGMCEMLINPTHGTFRQAGEVFCKTHTPPQPSMEGRHFL